MAVRLKDIAEVAGVDTSVVSRVLGGRAKEARIAVDCQNKIFEIAKQMNYKPNSSARAVRLGKFDTIILAQSKDAFKSYLPQSLLSSIYMNLEKNKIHLFLSDLPESHNSSKIPSSFQKMMADGMILNYTYGVSECTNQFVKKLQIPYIWVNKKSDQNCVYSDSFKAGVEITQKVVDAGHKRVLYLNTYYENSHYSTLDRFAGYEQTMISNGLEPLSALPAEEIHHDQDKELEFVINTLKYYKPTCVICYWSNAIAAVFRASHELKLRIPDDLSLITFTSESAIHYGLFATSMIEPDAELGKAAAEMILAKRESDHDCLSIVKDFNFYNGGTLMSL